jgi:hypothetical protein
MVTTCEKIKFQKYSGILNWFFKDAWEKHDKIFKPKILKPEFVI